MYLRSKQKNQKWLCPPEVECIRLVGTVRHQVGLCDQNAVFLRCKFPIFGCKFWLFLGAKNCIFWVQISTFLGAKFYFWGAKTSENFTCFCTCFGSCSWPLRPQRGEIGTLVEEQKGQWLRSKRASAWGLKRAANGAPQWLPRSYFRRDPVFRRKRGVGP